jgi:hypothetical protein
MPGQPVPDDVRTMADARAMARVSKDWAEADRLRSDIEAAGWKVLDRGLSYRLEPVAPPDVTLGDEVRYGRSVSVPARLDQPASGLATVVLIATDWPADLDRALAALRQQAPAGTEVVVVADVPSAAQEASLSDLGGAAAGVGGSPIEVVRTSERLGQAAAINIGIRRASAEVVIVLDTSVEPTGDIVTPLVDALGDPTVAVAGGWGIVSGDLRHFEDAPPGDVDAIEGYCLAFRRSDAAARGPLDEHFRFYRNLDIWWSLVLRDEGEGTAPRRAVALPDLPALRHEHRGYLALAAGDRDRLSKRNFYRILDRFGRRTDLLLDPRSATRREQPTT